MTLSWCEKSFGVTKRNSIKAWCCKEVFILINAWIVGRNFLKHHYQIRKNFTVIWYGRHHRFCSQKRKGMKDFPLNIFSAYNDLYVQNNTLLLVDVRGNFQNKCMEIFELYLAHFLSAPGLASQACLKR